MATSVDQTKLAAAIERALTTGASVEITVNGQKITNHDPAKLLEVLEKLEAKDRRAAGVRRAQVRFE